MKPTYDQLATQLQTAELRAARAERLLSYAYRFRGRCSPVNAWPKVEAYLKELAGAAPLGILRCNAVVPETSYRAAHRCEKTARANSAYCRHHEK